MSYEINDNAHARGELIQQIAKTEGEIPFGEKGGCPWPFTVRGKLPGKAGYMEVEVHGDRGDVILDIAKWLTKAGIRPFEIEAPAKAESKSSGNGNNSDNTKPPKPGACPSCGGNRWAWDKGDRGWYCTVSQGDEYCGFKSWKDSK